MVAKALFDELIKRRELVTTLESGELKGAWAENRAAAGEDSWGGAGAAGVSGFVEKVKYGMAPIGQ